MSKAIEMYLNDHLAGAMLGSDLAAQIRDQTEGTPLGERMSEIAADVEQDRQTLLDLMERLDVARNPVKQVTGWFAEKASRIKFSGASSGEADHGLLMALETLRLGVAGKRCLWLALQRVSESGDALRGTDLTRLIERASAQESALEDERMAAAARALAG